MSVFASRVTKVLPFGADSVTIKKLTGRALERAAQESQFRAGEYMARAGAGFREQVGKVDTSSAAAQAVLANPLNSYDRYTLAREGVVAWTFTENGAAVEVSPETIDDLDDDISETIAREVLRLSKPSLFQSADEQKAAQKND